MTNNNNTVNAAAVQIEARLCDIPYNIGHVGDLAEQALKGGAEFVALPEFFTTPIVFDERLYACALEPNNPAIDMLRHLAQKYGATLGGSYLELRNGDVFNTYVLAEPSGNVHRHDKDQPTMVENAFYIGGHDDGVAETETHRIGLAVCWETIRTRTIRRLHGNIDLLMTGSHWWSEPGWSFLRPVWSWVHNYNTALMQRTPGLFSKLVGVPNLHAAHCGTLEGQLQITSKRSVRTRTVLMGETQITNGHGAILARRSADEGPGVITAKISPGLVAAHPISEKFWIDNMPLLFRALWVHQNAVGRKTYERAKAEGRLTTYDFTRNEPL